MTPTDAAMTVRNCIPHDPLRKITSCGMPWVVSTT
jgi:hypothetical protein